MSRFPLVTRVPVLGLFSRAPVPSAPRYKEGGPSFPRGLLAAGLLLSAGCVVAPRDSRVHMAPKPMPRGPNLSEEAKVLIRSLYHDHGEEPSEIGEKLGRDQSTICRILFTARKKPGKVGRPRALSDAQVDRLAKKTQELVQKNEKRTPKRDVTKKQIKHSARVKASLRTISRRFKERKITFGPYKEKILLSADDKAERLKFAKKHAGKSPAQWNKSLHAVIDNKWFQVYHNGKHRDWIARRSCRGVYRGPGDGKYESWYVKPKGELRYNTGMKSACIMGGIGKGKVLMWAENPAKKWSGKAAATMYKKNLAQGLRKAYPAMGKKPKPSWVVLEDNDPAGYKSKAGAEAKKEASIKTLDLPKRSPDLNPLDFRIWHEVNRRMRATEQKWKAGKKESREQYLARLSRTAKSIPAPFVKSAVGDLTRRCKLVIKAKGGHFEESKPKKAKGMKAVKKQATKKPAKK